MFPAKQAFKPTKLKCSENEDGSEDQQGETKQLSLTWELRLA